MLSAEYILHFHWHHPNNAPFPYLFRLPQFIHSAACLKTGPYPLPKRVLHRVRSAASSFNFQFHLVFLGSYSICFHHIPRLFFPPILPSIFHSIRLFSEDSPYVRFDQSSWPSFILLHVGHFFPPPFYTQLTIFFTRSFHMVFCVFLQQHILKISDLLSEVTQAWAPHKTILLQR